MSTEHNEPVPSNPPILRHEHHFNVNLNRGGSTPSRLTAPALLAAAVAVVVRTEGEFKEINWLVPIFAALCVWVNI